MCLTEKMRVLDQLPSGMYHSAIGHGFNVNEPTTDTKLSISKIGTQIKQGYVLNG